MGRGSRAHPLGAGRRPFGGNLKGVSEPRRLAAKHSVTGSKAFLHWIKGSGSKSGMDVNDLILKFLVCIDCPQLSLY